MGRTFFALAASLTLSLTSGIANADDSTKSDGAGSSGEGLPKRGSTWGDGESGDKKLNDADRQTSATDAPPKPGEAWSHTDVYEAPTKGYWFIGARYRGTIVPKFLVNIFVNEGRTFYSNSVGIEADYRKDGFSIIPALTFAEYGFGDTLFLEKSKPEDFAGNWSRVNSSMKALNGSVDFLWSQKINENFDFEYGVGVGLGFIFGDLGVNWLYQDPNGKYTSEGGRKFSACSSEGDGVGCRKVDHSGASVAKVNNYVEPSWGGGGSRPFLFPHLSIPQLGLRYKPVKEVQARIGVGFALTGPWFGLSVDYGLEKKPKTATQTQP